MYTHTEYKTWSHKKELLNNQAEKSFNLKEREVWFCHCGLNIGHEQNGAGQDFLRPVLVLRKIDKDLFIGIPFTLQIRKKIDENLIISFNSRKNCVLVKQLRVYDKKRVMYKIGTIAEHQHNLVKEKVNHVIG